MLHCEICDYSETGNDTIYYTAIKHVINEVGNKVVFDEKTQQYLCVDCINASLANFRHQPIVYSSRELEPGEIELLDDEGELSVEAIFYGPAGNFKELRIEPDSLSGEGEFP